MPLEQSHFHPLQLDTFKEAFKAANQTGNAMNKLSLMKQGNRSVEELVTEFRLLVGQTGLGNTSPSDHLHLIRLF